MIVHTFHRFMNSIDDYPVQILVYHVPIAKKLVLWFP